MRHRIPTFLGLALPVCAAGVLAACGGGDHGDGLTGAQREDRAASASSAGLVSFAAGQIARATGETEEPRPIAGITPPADETSEPLPL